MRIRPLGTSVTAVLVAWLLGGVSGTSAARVGERSGTATAAAGPYASPCDATPGFPLCATALGPLVDVTAHWRDYQPALVQPVPIGDYAGDPEDSAPPVGAGVCGGEASAPSADGTPIPLSAAAAAPPPGVPAPPGTHGPYCVLRYVPADFTRLCATCRRLLVDYAHIPAGTVVSPPASGHWAGRLQWSEGNQLTAVVNGHSPNIKNLCSDKFVNPAPGATCSATTTATDQHFLEVESDTSIYHHYPVEGRYYNGPAYLAGDGAALAYHWVHGAVVDVDTAASGTGGTVWYQAGYRGAGDVAPDTDQSYGCICEVPPLGHTTFSAGSRLAAAGGGTTGGSGGGSAGGSPVAAGPTPAGPGQGGLPGTAPAAAWEPAAAPGAALGGLTVLLLARARRRRRRV